MKKLSLIILGFCLLNLQACSTIFNSGSQSIIASGSGDAESATIIVKTPNGSYKSKLPTTIVITPSSFDDTIIKVKDKCFEETSVKIRASVTPSFWANFLWFVGAPIAMTIDVLDGSMWKMDQQVLVPLDRIKKCKE